VQDPSRVTLIDPYVSVEVIENGAERDPWSPTPHQRRSLVAGIVVAVLVVTGLFASGLEERDRAADRVAAEALELVAEALPGAETLYDGRVGILLINTGRSAVRVLEARLDAAGYPSQGTSAPLLEPSSSTELLFQDLAVCSPALLSAPAYAVVVTARSHRGGSVTRSVPLSPTAFREVNYGARARCGYLPMEQAFVLDVVSAQRAPDGVLATVRVANDSVLPLRLERLRSGGGVQLTSVRPALPLALRRVDAPGTTPHWVTLTVRLQVTDCPALLAASAPRDRRLGGPLLAVWITRDSSIIETAVGLSRSVADLLRRSCD